MADQLIQPCQLPWVLCPQPKPREPRQPSEQLTNCWTVVSPTQMQKSDSTSVEWSYPSTVTPPTIPRPKPDPESSFTSFSPTHPGPQSQPSHSHPTNGAILHESALCLLLRRPCEVAAVLTTDSLSPNTMVFPCTGAPRQRKVLRRSMICSVQVLTATCWDPNVAVSTADCSFVNGQITVLLMKWRMSVG